MLLAMSESIVELGFKLVNPAYEALKLRNKKASSSLLAFNKYIFLISIVSGTNLR